MNSDRIDFLVSPIAVLGLSIKAGSALQRAGIETVLHLAAYTAPELGQKARDFGPKKRKEAEAALLRHNLRLGIAADYREQLEALEPGDDAELRDIAACFVRDHAPDARATAEDLDTLASTLIDPYRKKLMRAFTPAQLQSPEGRAVIEQLLDAGIADAQAKLGALRL